MWTEESNALELSLSCWKDGSVIFLSKLKFSSLILLYKHLHSSLFCGFNFFSLRFFSQCAQEFWHREFGELIKRIRLRGWAISVEWGNLMNESTSPHPRMSYGKIRKLKHLFMLTNAASVSKSYVSKSSTITNEIILFVITSFHYFSADYLHWQCCKPRRNETDYWVTFYISTDLAVLHVISLTWWAFDLQKNA